VKNARAGHPTRRFKSERLTKVIPEAQDDAHGQITPATPPAARVTAQPTQNSKKGFFVRKA
jgi:hypothetical protein